MVQITDARGNVHDYNLDIDALIQYETENPGWSLSDDLSSMDRLSFTTIDRLVRFIGGGSLKEFMTLGFGFDQFTDLFLDILREQGFIPPEQPSGASSEV